MSYQVGSIKDNSTVIAVVEKSETKRSRFSRTVMVPFYLYVLLFFLTLLPVQIARFRLLVLIFYT